MGRIVGIDLGTTNSVVATIDVGGCRIIQNREAEQQTRSIVGYYKNDFLIGSPALTRWPLAPIETILSIKRLMGRAISDPEVEKVKSNCLYEILEPFDGTRDSVCVKLGGKEYSPVEISALILKKIKSDAEYVLGDEVKNVVITVPAYFSDKQVDATRKAGLMAGLTVMKIIDEPTAAAVAYGIDSRERDAKTILVYDLGGGTFDISILIMSAGVFAILSKEGDMWLGGDNFDQIIVDFVLERIEKEYKMDPRNNLRFMATLKMQAQKAKEALSSARAAQIIISGLLRDSSGDIIDIEMDITREYFVEQAMPLIERTVVLTKKAVEDANLSVLDIDYVLMAGNSTCIPMVQEAMEKLFGKVKIVRKIHPKYCVAIGAAMTAAVLKGVVCPNCNFVNNDLNIEKCGECGYLLAGLEKTKTCPSCGEQNEMENKECKCGGIFLNKSSVDGGNAPFAYGIQTTGDKFNVFIKKNDRYPTPENKRQFQEFRTIYPNQKIVSIPVFGGDNFDKASNNEKQGEATAILPPNLHEGTVILVKLWLNENGSFDVEAKLEDGKDLMPRILRGGKDQKVIEMINNIDHQFVEKAKDISPAEKEELEKKYKIIIGKYNEGEIEEAYNEAENLCNAVKNAGAKNNGHDILQEAKGLVNVSSFILHEYSWRIGASAYGINKIIEELGQIINNKQMSGFESKMNQLVKEIDELLQRDKVLRIFVLTHLDVINKLDPVDPVLAKKLIKELGEVATLYKDGVNDAQGRLDSFLFKFYQILAEIELKEPGANGVKCHSCQTVNESTNLLCESCGAKLYILRDGSIKTSKK